MFFETGSYVTQDGLYLRMTLNPDPLVSTSWTRTACKDSYFEKNRHSFHIIRWMQTAVTKLVSFLSKHCPPVWVIFVIHCSSWNGLVGCNPCKGALCCLLLVMVKNYKVFFFWFGVLVFFSWKQRSSISYEMLETKSISDSACCLVLRCLLMICWGAVEMKVKSQHRALLCLGQPGPLASTGLDSICSSLEFSLWLCTWDQLWNFPLVLSLLASKSFGFWAFSGYRYWTYTSLHSLERLKRDHVTSFLWK